MWFIQFDRSCVLMFKNVKSCFLIFWSALSDPVLTLMENENYAGLLKKLERYDEAEEHYGPSLSGRTRPR